MVCDHFGQSGLCLGRCAGVYGYENLGRTVRCPRGYWIYDLSTAGLRRGTCTLTLETPDGQRCKAGFVLR